MAAADPPVFGVETMHLDLPALTGAFAERLRRAGLPVAVDRAVAFAGALSLVRPISKRRLYWTARAVFVSDRADIEAFNAVFRAVFGHGPRDSSERMESDHRAAAPESADERSDSAAELDPTSASRAFSLPGENDGASTDSPQEVPVPLAPSEEEVLRQKRFEELTEHELARLYQLMTRMKLAAPLRRTRRVKRYSHGERVDLRRTLRGSLHTGGDPFRLRHQRRRVLPRRIVLLCDISGSMEPYARAYLQFLTCAAGGARRSEAFVFATRLTRLTRALASRSPGRAIRNAAAAAPDWSSGTRIGDALKEFNDRHGRRGMARGAVVVILSDGWERGDPALVGQQMERLRRLTHRIVWVNPRAGAEGFVPRSAGMLAALPYCDAFVSGHDLESLAQVVDAIAGGGTPPGRAAPADQESDEAWASATPVAGSSVAMPSGYGPKRGHTTPGWGT